MQRAADILRTGGLVAFPTETVYGLGADARDSQGLHRIFSAKQRPLKNPLILHVANIQAAERLVKFNDCAHQAAAAFWPGPLTLLLPLRPDSGISPVVAAGQERVGIRIPDHDIALRLLNSFGHPIAAPSANRSNHVSPTQAAHVVHDLDGRIDAVIEGGNCRCGLESTILMSSEEGIMVLRQGVISESEIAQKLGIFPTIMPVAAELQTPGQHCVHYAPNAPLRTDARKVSSDEVWIGFGPDQPSATLNLSLTGDLDEAAARLYATLRQADQLVRSSDHIAIACAPVPTWGIGKAINDRLIRAAGRRRP